MTQPRPTFRDRLWLWGHCPGVHDRYGLPRPSSVTPEGAAAYMGIPNLLMIRYDKYPEPPYDGLAKSLKPLRRVVWGLVGAGGRTSLQERKDVLRLPEANKNITGFMLDDFWSGGPEGNGGIILPLDELRRLHDEVQQKSLDLWVVLYVSELFRKREILPYLEHLDRFTLWSWFPEHLRDLDTKLAMFRDLIPDKPRYLGCYLWDYGRCQPMPLDVVKLQCRRGLELTLEGELDGLIFLGSPVCDVGLEAVEWVRNWIEEVGDTRCK